MFCPNCGKEIIDNKKFCGHCGTKLNSEDANKKTLPTISVCIVLSLLIGISTFAVYSINNKENGLSSGFHKTIKMPAEILVEIDEYQARYWEIVRRHDLLLAMDLDSNLECDKKELDSLFHEVEEKISKQNSYLQQYRSIKKQYSEFNGDTTGEMVEYAGQEYKAIDKLLNDTYKEVKSKIPPEDFKKLTQSELKWLKDVNDYQNVFDAEDRGSFGRVLNIEYEINMRSFRTLLLMLYL